MLKWMLGFSRFFRRSVELESPIRAFSNVAVIAATAGQDSISIVVDIDRITFDPAMDLHSFLAELAAHGGDIPPLFC